MKKVLFVFGTRPEAIKMCPLILEMKKRNTFQVTVCVTGQHKEMLNQVLEAFGVIPDHDLAIMKKGQTLFSITTAILDKIEAILKIEQPDLVLVHGDTSTAFTTALACYYMKIPVGHVEAGLRTRNLYSPFPEEFNRRAISIISVYNFAPTQMAQDNLLNDNCDPLSISVTGNTVIDALSTTVRPDYHHPELDWAFGSRLILVTAHRRENIGDSLHQMMKAIRKIVDNYPDVKVIYPVHLNPAVEETAFSELGNHNRIHLIEPLSVLDFHNFMARAYFIMTDSGGIQEEAPALGKPVLVMRNTTERPEGVKAGTLRLVGTEIETIYRNACDLLDNSESYQKMSQAKNPYGDGTASKCIADILERE